MSGLGELYRPRREPMCFDGSNGRMPGGGSSPMSSSNSGAPKQAVVQTPVKTENCCAASSLVSLERLQDRSIEYYDVDTIPFFSLGSNSWPYL